MNSALQNDHKHNNNIGLVNKMFMPIFVKNNLLLNDNESKQYCIKIKFLAF